MANEEPKRWEQQLRDAALRVEETCAASSPTSTIRSSRHPARRLPGAARRRRRVAEAGPAHG